MDSEERVLTYCQVEQLGWPDEAEEAVHVLEHGPEHLVERRRRAHLDGSISTRQAGFVVANSTAHG